MSPKSRGRPNGRGRSRTVRQASRPGVVEELLREAQSLVREQDAVLAETWASGWLGAMWEAAVAGSLEEAGSAELGLCRLLAVRVTQRPSAPGLAALHAFARVAVGPMREDLDAALAGLGDRFPTPPFALEPSAEATRAWVAEDVWGAERLLFVEFSGPTVHTLMAQVVDVGAPLVETLALPLGSDVAAEWAEHRTTEDVPMEPVEVPVDTALADLAEALASTEVAWGNPEDEHYTDLRALALQRSMDHRGDRPEQPPTPPPEREQLLAAFVAEAALPDGAQAAALVPLFLDFGDAALRDRPLGWSPMAVMVFLADALPRAARLDEAQREALPDVLQAWLRFALGRRGVPRRWVDPVVDTVEVGMPEYDAAVTAQVVEAAGP